MIISAGSKAGFFVLEVIVALLVCLAAGASFLLVFRELQPIQIKYENVLLLSQIRWLTVLAQECQQPLLLKFEDNGYKAFFRESPQRILFKRRLPSRISIDAENPELAFYPSQAVSPASLELRYDGEVRCRIVLSLRGRVRSDC